ncbi:GH36-type glycosyl hydrolase domain-containing protein [Evansella cellulosilytica]|uniref:Carbohydrate binding protein n=1 Tax=Evansella cellulosilytica (strain ATCC 21833 / DSM 2522 / FERM P-1141 / JCM 9156 / N-4) TaxID=649639 RepID=E6TR76_EVAC2|nr:glycosyl transferase [Evansella cellulosilytica]ADU30588.1 carbohydrate binding protein [Evansella cellulosilytica DSM 2522]
MKYGYFNDETREYVITNPKTPTKWINYVGNLKFGGFVDQTGGSLICKGDPALNRIVKYLPQLPSYEFNGETTYIRVKENDSYNIFSPYYVPTLDKYDLYECRVGLGYSKYISEINGIRTEITVFVPENDPRLIRDIKVTNLRTTPVELDLIPVVEYTHFDALKQFTNADWVPQTMESKLIEEENGFKVLTQNAFMNRGTSVNYFTSNHPISSIESDRKIFLGDNEFGTWANPLSLQNEELSNYEASRGDNIGALLHHLGEIAPGESKRVITQLGQGEEISREQNSINKYRDEKNVDEAFNSLAKFWDNYLSKLQVETPDEQMNTLLNIHNPRQCYITKNWSRDLSLYQLGFGGRGIGFRDSSQDVLGVIPNYPEDARELIEKLLHTQKRNGSAMHQFFASTMEANEGDSRERPDRPDYYGDDHLWIVQSVCSYVKETGNIDFLNKEIPFYEKDSEGNPQESGTVLEHLKRSVHFTRNDTGANGLPLLGFADWNDTINLPTGAESFINAHLYGKALLELIDLLEFLGETETVETYKTWYAEMKEVVNNVGWDGEWYIRYIDHDGEPLGSHKNAHGQIYVNGQTWATISGFATEERAETALDSVYRILNTKNGIKLSYPGFNGFDPNKGGITTYPPGAKENGGIFLHTNPWAMIAETIVGNGDRAFEYYKQVNPVYKNDKIDEYEIEPYVYPQNILGDEHPQFGLGRNSWLSGTSSWMYQAGTKYILGIMAAYDGLIINPCIPKEWDGFKATKYFRNATYEIEVINSNHISKGVKSMTVDGEKIEGNKAPIFNDGKTHKVVVVLED